MMDVLYRLQEATAKQVQAELAGNPQYSTVRALLRILEEKGHIVHREQQLRYVYRPVVPRHEAAQCALQRLIKVFFADSYEELFKALLRQMSSPELDRAGQILEKLRQ